jgi:hypothetical protein
MTHPRGWSAAIRFDSAAAGRPTRLRHSDREILAFFRDERTPDNVLLWVHPDSHLPEQHQTT